MWCWAASALMVGKTYNPNSTKTQSDIVRHVTGSTQNADGGMWEIRNGCNYISGYTDFKVVSGILSIEQIIQKLRQGHPIVLGRYFYKSRYDTKHTHGHTFVIYGYKYYSKDDVRFYVRDPWPVQSSPWPEHNTGKTVIWKYADLVNGWDSGYDKGKWAYSLYR